MLHDRFFGLSCSVYSATDVVVLLNCKQSMAFVGSTKMYSTNKDTSHKQNLVTFASIVSTDRFHFFSGSEMSDLLVTIEDIEK